MTWMSRASTLPLALATMALFIAPQCRLTEEEAVQGDSSIPGTPVAGGMLRVGIRSEPQTWNRLLATDEVSHQITERLHAARRCCTARSKSLTSLCRLQSHPAQYVSGIPSAAILLSISHPIRCSTRCLANVRARISGPMIAL